MNITDLMKHRLVQLGYEQRELAVAAEVTESYISQLLSSIAEPSRSPPFSKRGIEVNVCNEGRIRPSVVQYSKSANSNGEVAEPG